MTISKAIVNFAVSYGRFMEEGRKMINNEENAYKIWKDIVNEDKKVLEDMGINLEDLTIPA
jgi:hypothetical protein